MVDVRNARSQAAVEKLGADKDGVLRNHKITWTGHVRDTAVFSITDADWPGVKQRLDYRLHGKFRLGDRIPVCPRAERLKPRGALNCRNTDNNVPPWRVTNCRALEVSLAA
jgi:hypothetical protein